MPDDDEVIELRALQERAYGRGGGLTAAEAERLDHLVRRRAERIGEDVHAGSVAPERTVAGVTDDDGHSVRDARHGQEQAATPSPDAPSPASPSPASASPASPSSGGDALPPVPVPSHRALRRERWRPMLIAIAAALLVGIGSGWFLFGRGGVEAVALTPAQQEWQQEIIGAATYDQGSLRAVAVEAGVVLWIATKKDGDLTCLVLGDGAHTTAQCDASEVVRESGLYGTLVVERGEGQTEVTAQMMLTAAGEPAVASDSYEYDPEAMTTSYATEEEERFAETLVAQGFDARTVWVVGYDDEVPIWTGVRREESMQCLIYGTNDGVADVGCADPETGEGLWVEHVDPGSAQKTRVEWQFTASRGANLVITREGGPAHGAVEE